MQWRKEGEWGLILQKNCWLASQWDIPPPTYCRLRVYRPEHELTKRTSAVLRHPCSIWIAPLFCCNVLQLGPGPLKSNLMVDPGMFNAQLSTNSLSSLELFSGTPLDLRSGPHSMSSVLLCQLFIHVALTSSATGPVPCWISHTYLPCLHSMPKMVHVVVVFPTPPAEIAHAVMLSWLSNHMGGKKVKWRRIKKH